MRTEAEYEMMEEMVEATIRLTRKQLRVFMSEKDITLAIAGIRGGKTHVGALKTIFYAIQHPTEGDECHLVCSPTYQMSLVPVEKLFKLLYDKTIFPINPLIKYVRGQRTFILSAADGRITRIMVRSLHDPDRLRGIKALSAWIDEGAYVEKYAWDVVQGRLADSNGPCWVTTTPYGYNWVHELYEQAVNGDKTVRVVHWSSDENTFLGETGAKGLLRLTKRFDAKTYQQEVQARFIRGRGSVYYPFRRSLHCKPVRIKNTLYVGQDFNVDPMASVLAVPYTTPDGEDGAHVCYVRKERDSNTQSLAQFLDRFISEHHINKANVTLYPDAAGNARSTSGKSDFRILRDNGFYVNAPSRNPAIKDRVNCVNGLFAPMHSRHPRLLVDPSCQPLIESLEKQIWEPKSDPPTPDKSMGFDHLNDALGYMCWRRWPLKSGTVIGSRKRAA